MADQKIGVMLDFKANTSQAKNAMQNLQNSLSQIANKTNITVNSESINAASQAALQLQRHLAAATDVNTGKLDLTKFNASLSSSGTSLKGLTTELMKVGTNGQQSFVQLAQVMSQAQQPAFKLSGMLNNMWITLKNTARWQLSSSILMGFTQTLSKAYNFAQDLNASLNDIRIVTGQGVSQMKNFADEANRAAKALSTTTNEYAKASLIYFQQGLNSNEVQERTNLTIKMANVTGQSVSEVSDQLTAVWNNFDDGTKSLEYYVDVMTALGAATASSSEEISEGLNKFAAVAETVGLSYEYAAAALATVTATTRQSADIVGTAFKTLFARIQDLELGKTLDDGTTLGQYSQALATVGINIKDVNGEVKDMNSILDEMGAKWDTLSKDVQIALAQNVAGVRQYTQLIALMDNWDFFKENLNVANDSEGTLSKQASIYAESWEAARNKVTANLEDIYQSVLNDEFFIKMSNLFADLISGVDNFIDGLGGIQPLLSGIFSFVLMSISGKIQPMINSLGNSLLSLTSKGAAKVSEKQTNELNSIISEEVNRSDRNYNVAEKTSLTNSTLLLDAKNKMWKMNKKLTDSERMLAQIRLNGIESTQAQAEAIAQQIVELQELIQTQDKVSVKNDVQKQIKENRSSQQEDLTEDTNQKKQILNQRKIDIKKIESYETQIQKARELLALEQEGSKAYEKKLIQIKYLEQEQTKLIAASGFLNKGVSEEEAFLKMKQSIGGLTSAYNQAQAAMDQYNTNTEMALKNQTAIVEQLVTSYNEAGQAASKAGQEATMAFGNEDDKMSLGANAAKGIMSTTVNTDSMSNSSHGSTIETAKTEIINLRNAFDELGIGLDTDVKKAFEDATSASVNSGKKMKEQIDNIISALGKMKLSTSEVKNIIDKMGAGKGIVNTTKNIEQQKQKYEELKKKMIEVTNAVNNFDVAHKIGGLEVITNIGGMAMSLSMLISSVKSLTNAFKDGFDPAEDFTTVLMSLGMIIPGAITIVKKLSEMTVGLTVGSTAAAAAARLHTQAIKDKNAAEAISVLMDKEANEELKIQNLEKLKASLITMGLANADNVESIAQQVLTGARINDTKATFAQTIAEKLQAKAKSGSTAANWLYNAALQAGIISIDASTGAIIANAAALMAHPIMWILAIIMAVIAAIVIVISVINAQSKAVDENAKAIVENSKKNLELIETNQKLAESVEELIEKYEDLKATGESVYETLEDLKEQMPELIASYAELENALGIDLGLDRLEDAWNVSQITEDLSAVSEEIERVNRQVAQAELEQAQAGANAAKNRMLTNATKGANDGQINNGKYKVTIGGAAGWGVPDVEYNGKIYSDEEEAASQVLKDVMGEEMWDGSQIQFDASTTAGVIEGYQKMAAARSKMESEFSAEELSHMDTYRELNRELKEMEESYADLLEFSNTVQKRAKEDFGLGGDKDLANEFNISDLESYSNKRAAIIEDLKKQYEGLTESQIEALLASSEVFSYYETSLNLFKDEGKLASDLKQRGALALESVQAWYEKLPENDKKLFLGIDFTTVDSLEEASEELEKLREKAAEAEILEKVKGLEIEEETFKSYTEILVDNNAELEENNSLAKQIALNNLRVNKGITELAESWEKISDILKKANRNTLEYAEAIGQIKSSLKTAFEYEPSTQFIEDNLSVIQKLVEGDIESLQVLQDSLAEDFVLNLDYKTAIFGESFTQNEIQDKLTSFLDQLDTSLEIGEDVEINQHFYDSLQEMLDNGQLATDDLQKMMRMKGFEMEITGWKTIKGPETKTYRKVVTNQGGKEEEYTEVISTSEDIQVPIINGDDTNISSGSITGSANIKRSNTSDNIFTLNENKKEKDDKIKELDRYHEIKEELADIERGLDKIAKAKDRAFGKARLDLINQEIKQQEKLNAAEQRYYDQIKTNYDNDLKKLDWRFELDESGRIKNYTQVLQDLINNGIEGEPYEEIKKSADQYEETLNLLEEQQEKVNEGILTLKDLALEKIEYEVEINVHFNDREIKRLEHLLKNLEDPAQDAAEAIALLGRTAERNLKNVDTYMKGIKDVLGESFSEEQKTAFENLLSNMPSEEDLPNALRNILGEDTQITDKQKTDLENYIDSLYQSSDAMDEFYDSIMEKVNGAFDDMNDKSEKAINRVEQLGSTLEAYQNIIDLVGKKALGVTDAQIRALGRAQVAQAKSNLEIIQGQLNLNKAALSAAQTQRAAAEEAKDAEAVKYWDEQIETIQDKVWELEGEVESAWGETLQTIADDFANAVETSTSAFEEAMTGIYGSYDKMQDVFDQQKEIGDRYVEDYQKIYELSKLNRDITNSMDDTDSIKAKQTLRDLQEEINTLQESDTEMSQHDLDYLRKKYELRLAEIALEEAQNAKSQVRMRRDSEGNWSYVYTADEDKTASAQQNFEDKLYEIQELEQNYIDEMQDRVLQAEIDMVEELNKLRAEDFATQEDYQAEITRITEYYTGMRNYALDELNKAIDNSKDIYENDWNEYNQKTGYKISKEGEWRKAFKDTEYAMITGYSDIGTARSTFETNTSKMINSLTGAFSQWELDVKGTFELVEQDFDTFAKKDGPLDKKVNEITTKLGKIDTAFDSWSGKAKSGFESITEAATAQFTEFSNKIQDYKTEIDTIANAITKLLELAGTEIPAPNVTTGTNGVENENPNEEPTPTEKPETEKKHYYGTYYDPTTGKQRVTKGDYYVNEISAEAGARIEAKKFAKALINEHQYNRSIGKEGKFADYTEESLYNLIKEKGFGFSEYETNTINNGKNLSDLGGHDILAIKDINGTTTYLSSGNYEVGTSSHDGYYSLTLKGEEKNFLTTISEDNLQKIIDKWGNNNILYAEESVEKEIPLYSKVDEKYYLVDSILPGDTITPPLDMRSIRDEDYYPYKEKSYGYKDGTRMLYYKGLDLKEALGFDTGGYTGDWDSSGRLAMLHQKEIVLNAHDTENFLSAINIVRDIASIIDLRAAAQQSALSQMTAASVAPTAQTLQQEVTIHAEFPNATQRTEIEAAFDTLLNRASQFANRKN